MKKTIIILITLIISFGAIYGAWKYIDTTFPHNEMPSVQKPHVEENIAPEKNDKENELKISFIMHYQLPYKLAQVNTDVLIDGSFAKRTVMVFTITGYNKLNTMFRNLKVFEGEEFVPCDIIAKQYNDDDVLVFAVCDGKINPEKIKTNITLISPETNEEKTFSQEFTNDKLIISEHIHAGTIFKVSENGYYYRGDNSDEVNALEKNDKKGHFYEFSRTLNFLSFGPENKIDPNFIFNSEIELPYIVDFSLTEREYKTNNYVPYKNENTTNEKQLTVKIKVYADKLTERELNNLKIEIDKSNFKINNNTIGITDGFVKSETRKD